VGIHRGRGWGEDTRTPLSPEREVLEARRFYLSCCGATRHIPTVQTLCVVLCDFASRGAGWERYAGMAFLLCAVLAVRC